MINPVLRLPSCEVVGNRKAKPYNLTTAGNSRFRGVGKTPIVDNFEITVSKYLELFSFSYKEVIRL